MSDNEYASFLVRCWLKSTADDDANWEAEIEHIQTGQSVSLRSPEELVTLLHEWPPCFDTVVNGSEF